MTSSDDSDDSIGEGLKDFEKRLTGLKGTFRNIRDECIQFPSYVSERKSDQIRAYSERFEKKCDKIKELRKKFIKDTKKHGPEIEKRLSDIEEINKNLKEIRDSIRRKRETADAFASTEDLNTTATTIIISID